MALPAIRVHSPAMQLAFILAGPASASSGPATYIRHVVAGLREAGHDLVVVKLPGVFPVTDETARSAARGALASLAPDRLAIIDGLAIPAFAGQGDSLASRLTIALVHHPRALATGVTDGERAALRNTELRLLPRFTRVIATSAAVSERLSLEFGVDPTRMRVVAPGIDAAARSPGSPGAASAILSIGALIPRKGHDVLIRALARLFDLDWKLTITGTRTRDRGCAAALEELTRELDVNSRIRFAGELDEFALEPLWQGADIFALASYWESYPVGVAQALKRGVPIAITSEGPASGIIPPDAGIVCRPGDVEQSLQGAAQDDFRRRTAQSNGRCCLDGRPSSTGLGSSGPRIHRCPLFLKEQRMLLGAVADDFTGATDLASMLVRNGMRTVQLIGVPQNNQPVPDADAVIVALKSRTAPVEQAVAESRESLRWLRTAGGRQFFFKYCSTFDSTDQGNIGPVADALLSELGAKFALACPAFPANGRTIYLGYLFAGSVLLNESGMEHHPLTPMKDPNLVRVLGRQTDGSVGLVPYPVVFNGSTAIHEAMCVLAARGHRYAIIDAINDEHLIAIGEAAASHVLITGGSGVAMGLPQNFRRSGLLPEYADPAALPAVSGPSAVLAGSCSRATLAQIEAARQRVPGTATGSSHDTGC